MNYLELALMCMPTVFFFFATKIIYMLHKGKIALLENLVKDQEAVINKLQKADKEFIDAWQKSVEQRTKVKNNIRLN